QGGMARSAADFIPAKVRTLEVLREAAAGCRGCDLYGPATQTVFGEGDPHARLMLVGEKPGGREDKEGHPFVGPAGRGPGRRPEVMVLLGATAAQAIVGRAFRITRQRGELLAVDGRPAVIATWHPSAILRANEHEDRARMREELAGDLEAAARFAPGRRRRAG